MMTRQILRARRESVTQKAHVAHHRTLYLSPDAGGRMDDGHTVIRAGWHQGGCGLGEC